MTTSPKHKLDCARSIDDMGLCPCTCNADTTPTPPITIEACKPAGPCPQMYSCLRAILAKRPDCLKTTTYGPDPEWGKCRWYIDSIREMDTPTPCHLCNGAMVVPSDDGHGLQRCVCVNGEEPRIADKTEPTPPVPTEAEVREARERLESLRQTRHLALSVMEQEAVWGYVRTIRAALDKAQGEVERLTIERDSALNKVGKMAEDNCRKHINLSGEVMQLRAKNARLVALMRKDAWRPESLQFFREQVAASPTSLACRAALINALEAENAAQAEQIKRLREALAQIQRNASANRVWSGEKWTYLGLTYVAQTKIVRLADEALKEASND